MTDSVQFYNGAEAALWRDVYTATVRRGGGNPRAEANQAVRFYREQAIVISGPRCGTQLAGGGVCLQTPNHDGDCR